MRSGGYIHLHAGCIHPPDPFLISAFSDSLRCAICVNLYMFSVFFDLKCESDNYIRVYVYICMYISTYVAMYMASVHIQCSYTYMHIFCDFTYSKN